MFWTKEGEGYGWVLGGNGANLAEPERAFSALPACFLDKIATASVVHREGECVRQLGEGLAAGGIGVQGAAPAFAALAEVVHHGA